MFPAKRSPTKMYFDSTFLKMVREILNIEFKRFNITDLLWLIEIKINSLMTTSAELQRSHHPYYELEILWKVLCIICPEDPANRLLLAMTDIVHENQKIQMGFFVWAADTVYKNITAPELLFYNYECAMPIPLDTKMSLPDMIEDLVRHCYTGDKFPSLLGLVRLFLDAGGRVADLRCLVKLVIALMDEVLSHRAYSCQELVEDLCIKLLIADGQRMVSWKRIMNLLCTRGLDSTCTCMGDYNAEGCDCELLGTPMIDVQSLISLIQKVGSLLRGDSLSEFIENAYETYYHVYDIEGAYHYEWNHETAQQILAALLCPLDFRPMESAALWCVVGRNHHGGNSLGLPHELLYKISEFLDVNHELDNMEFIHDNDREAVRNYINLLQVEPVDAIPGNFNFDSINCQLQEDLWIVVKWSGETSNVISLKEMTRDRRLWDYVVRVVSSEARLPDGTFLRGPLSTELLDSMRAMLANISLQS